MGTVSGELIEHLKRIEPAETVDRSLGQLLKKQAEEKLKEMRALARYYQMRYSVSVEEFYLRKLKDQEHTWADEETYFDWSSALQMAEDLEKEIAAIEELLAHADG